MNIRQLVQSSPFNNFIVAVILVNAVLIGLSTYLTDATALRAIAAIEMVCVVIYLVEIVLRFMARDSTSAFFRDGWNIFDLVIVIAALVPASSGIGPVLRILRVFRVLRLVKTIPELRLIVTVLLRSVASMKYVALLATILFYVYAVIGVKLFGGEGHPMQAYFASIHEACFTLFRILTGDDWTQMRYELAQAGHPLGAFTAFQVSWIVVATFLLVNLIVGAVITTGMSGGDASPMVNLSNGATSPVRIMYQKLSSAWATLLGTKTICRAPSAMLACPNGSPPRRSE